jgi:hypothetical protein
MLSHYFLLLPLDDLELEEDDFAGLTGAEAFAKLANITVTKSRPSAINPAVVRFVSR